MKTLVQLAPDGAVLSVAVSKNTALPLGDWVLKLQRIYLQLIGLELLVLLFFLHYQSYVAVFENFELRQNV